MGKKTERSNAVEESRRTWEWPVLGCQPTPVVAQVLSVGYLQRIAESVERQEVILRHMDQRQKEPAAKRKGRA